MLPQNGDSFFSPAQHHPLLRSITMPIPLASSSPRCTQNTLLSTLPLMPRGGSPMFDGLQSGPQSSWMNSNIDQTQPVFESNLVLQPQPTSNFRSLPCTTTIHTITTTTTTVNHATNPPKPSHPIAAFQFATNHFAATTKFLANAIVAAQQKPRSLCLLRHIISSLPHFVLESLLDLPEENSPTNPARTATTFESVNLSSSATDCSALKRKQCDTASDVADEPAAKKAFLEAQIHQQQQQKQFAQENEMPSSANVLNCVQDQVLELLSWLPASQQRLQTTAELSAALCSKRQSMCQQAKNIDAQLDELVGQSTTKQVPSIEDSHIRNKCPKDGAFLLILEELKFVLTNLQQDSESSPCSAATSAAVAATSAKCAEASATAMPRTTHMRTALSPSTFSRLLITILFVLVCRYDGASNVLDAAEQRPLRNWAMSVFFRAMLHPCAPKANSPDPTLLGKIGLAKLDAKQKKIPREVVESVLRPALQHFCSLKKLDLKLIVGLRSVVELFPTLFKEVFGLKILDTLDVLSQPVSLAETFGVEPEQVHTLSEVRAMVIHMLDFFHLFASTNAFSCEQWLGRLTAIAVQFERIWPAHQCEHDASCSGFRAPLCRLFCLYPLQAQTLMYTSVAKPPANCTAVELRGLFHSITKCKHALPVRRAHLEDPLMAPPRDSLPASFGDFVNNKQLADTTLLVGPERQRIDAHRVVLSRSAFFRRMFLGGFRETFGAQITLEDVDPKAFNIALRFLYNDSINLGELPVEVLVETFVVADRFALGELQSMCELQLAKTVNGDSWQQMLNLALSTCVGEMPDSAATLTVVDTCGEFGGETLLRACKSFILANLHTVADELEWTDPVIAALLGVNPSLSDWQPKTQT